MRRRVAVTGLGVVAPGGIGIKDFWELLVAGRTATRAMSLFDASRFRSRIAAECDFDPLAEGLRPEDVYRLDRHVQFGLVAAREAVEDAGLSAAQVDPWRLGVSMGTAVGATIKLEDEYVEVSGGGAEWLVDPARAHEFLYHALVPSTLAAEVATAHGARGQVMTVSTGCTSGLDAVGHGAGLIESGRADVVIAGAADAPISPISVACFDAIKATSTRNDEPEAASRPFDATRDGFVLGEGAAVLVLEEIGHALRRGAPIYCEVGGFGTFGNAYHMTGLTTSGIEMARAITTALNRAKAAPDEVGYVNAHGSSTKQNDRHETAAVKRSLGEHARRTPMSSIKSMIGHSLGAIGSLELVACVLAMDRGVVPPTANYAHPDPECDLDYVPNQARELKTDLVLSVGSGFGGFQSAVVLDRAGRRGRR
ncbi:beta-ketoacyl-[acyl-carrier-protein] synthase family protein [Micromonospora carbonacea]|uniref:Beta-ketoacyl-[acyl-carrier-protein] synthase family protein n=1 Tax=Micromonospora carbonacea TaxID=47853 RepID=A0A7H8XLH8_9ACTN|nr:beta-ketoacyl-[acyl-carrier-protein] synthase family protein [Micromonospora carbonacea]MBB5825927.1 minimal PKS ketosynthase (KS/KS alpha) [Micromonospora carbonacea]QLD25520.1 beta-ketoacyl-[acyl-carrier-protein] synthase family protein [Micromonospora carbonacea]